MTQRRAEGRGPGSGVGGPGALAVLALLAAGAVGAQVPGFDETAAWRAVPADGVSLQLAGDAGPSGKALRLEFDFRGHGGWAAARRSWPVDLPEAWELSFWVRGEAPANTLEVKLVDASGENVWWSVRRSFAFPEAWRRVKVRSRDLSFAWGPAGNGRLCRAGFLEVAITAGSGGKGTVWLADLALTSRPAVEEPPAVPVASASSALPGHGPELVLEAAGAGWRSDPAAGGETWLDLAFERPRELGGLAVDWDPRAPPRAFEVLVSDDGTAWEPRWRVVRTQGGRSLVPLPDTETRRVRVAVRDPGPQGVGVLRMTLLPVVDSASDNAFVAMAARAARRGVYPRSFLGEQTLWTVVGPAGRLHPLLDADGAFDPAAQTFSVEPFVRLDGTLVTWADVTATPTLAEGELPIPTVTWSHPAFTLEVTAFDSGAGADATVVVRYRLRSRAASRIEPELLLALRPLQVNPPSQFLNTAGGVVRNGSVSCEGRSLLVDRTSGVVARPAADRCGATCFDTGEVVALLERGDFPAASSAPGPLASGALAWRLPLEPGASGEVAVAVPASEAELLGTPWVGLPGTAAASEVAVDTAARLEWSSAAWRERLGRVVLTLPDAELAATVRANLGFILASRDGAALRPGVRAYARSWTRDGAMMAEALLRLGHADAVRDYILWLAPHIYPSGKVPCVVDARGADPVPEHDSQGEWLFLVAEYLRFTGDRDAAAAVWPQVAGAVAYLDELRQRRRTAEYRSPEKLPFFGLLPESISHEGYSAKPMHSYWDSFWALRGMKDAVELASALGHDVETARWTEIRDELAADMKASVAATMARHGLDVLPGCVELGDFDPTSSTVVSTIAQATDLVPPGSLAATWERYWREVEARHTGTKEWDVYTPYEWRNVAAMVRLGWRERVEALSGWLLADRRPTGWRQWAEVVPRDAATARFVGDMPHAWVGSDFIRATLDRLALEDEGRRALVLGAGVPASWLDDGGKVGVRRLVTRHGALTFTMRGIGKNIQVQVEGDLRVPSGGVVLSVPFPVDSATVNGRDVPIDAARQRHVPPAGELVLRELPADVVLRSACH